MRKEWDEQELIPPNRIVFFLARGVAWRDDIPVVPLSAWVSSSNPISTGLQAGDTAPAEIIWRFNGFRFLLL